jgi:hypothetical protein
MTYLLYIDLLFDGAKSCNNKQWKSIRFKNIQVSLEIKLRKHPSPLWSEVVRRLAQNSVNLKHFITLTRMFILKQDS